MGNKNKNKSQKNKSFNANNKTLSVSIISENLFFDKIKPIFELAVIILGLIVGYLELRKITEQTAMQNQQIEIQNQQTKKQYIWNKKDATFRYLDGYTESLRNTTDNLSILLQKDSIEKVFGDKEQKVRIMNLVGYFENLAIGIDMDYYDEDVAISSLYRQALIAYGELTKHRYFIVRENEVGRPTAKNFRKLAEEWKQKYKN
jgi:hypothetical protein